MNESSIFTPLHTIEEWQARNEMWQATATYQEAKRQYLEKRTAALDLYRRADAQYCCPDQGVQYDPSIQAVPGDMQKACHYFSQCELSVRICRQLRSARRACGEYDLEFWFREDCRREEFDLDVCRRQLVTAVEGYLLRRSSALTAEELLAKVRTPAKLIARLHEEDEKPRLPLGPKSFGRIRVWAADEYLLNCNKVSSVRGAHLLEKSETIEGRVALLQEQEDSMAETFGCPYDVPPADFPWPSEANA